ncbi:type II secretion system F family protein [Clostridium sp. CX1]|uniref:type II secretion system F family protein n=1 Tax=Clostridium sp. CX1 TaxID=2978346 RepID=UPI0021C1239B|nr:type II secretion system F family protein [Clostridium sp. CX1]MCT8976318.1 type II secretion system F family protein [Clostridium sp. CX1]
MKKYLYKAYDENFNIIKGVIEEDDGDIAEERLRDRGLKLIYIKEKNDIFQLKLFKMTLSDENLSDFCGQIAIIVNSGVSIVRGLEILYEQTKKKNMKKVIQGVLTRVREGRTLTAAMEAAGVFPRLLTDMVRTGELSGEIDTILFNMESYYKKEASVKTKIKSASIYPVLILVVAIAMMAFFNFYIFGEVEELFKDNTNLPAITKLLLICMDYINNNMLIITILIFAIIILVIYAKTLPKVRYSYDKILLKLPIIRDAKMNIMTARFTRTMGIFLKSAVPMLEILDNLKYILGNEFAATKIENVKREIINGNKIADSLENEKMFEPLVIQMIRVGEETGKLEEMLFSLADRYDIRVETSISRLTSLVEPVLTLLIGLIVGTVIVAVTLPIMQMSQGLQ